jgi:hypothetical protein
MQTKQVMSELIKKLETCLTEAGFSPETKRNATGAVIAARLTADDGPLQVVAQIQTGGVAEPANHGLATRDAQHLVDQAIRPTLGARAAAGAPKPATATAPVTAKKPE